MKKKFLKVCQAFGLVVNKAVKFTEALKYAIISIPLAVSTPKSALYQPEKAELRNNIINLSKSSSHEYSRDVRWVVKGMAAIR